MELGLSGVAAVAGKLRGKHRPILNDNLGGGFEAFLYDAYDGRTVEYRGTREIHAAIADLERELAALQEGSRPRRPAGAAGHG